MLCANCGQFLPAAARFCFLCGAPDPIPESAAAHPPAARPLPRAERTCRIGLWRGYLKSEFCVTLDEPDGGVREHRSPAFRWSADEPPPPDRADVRAAYAALVSRLHALGWEHAGRSQPWYAQEFRPRQQGARVVSSGEPERGAGARGAR